MGLKRELDLTDIEAEALLRTAEQKSERDFLIIALAGASAPGEPGRGLRIGEIVGVKQTTKYQAWIDKENHSKGRETRVSVTELPGIHAEDLREGSVWVKRKGGIVRQTRLPIWLYQRLIEFARGRTGKLFSVRERQAYDMVKQYARVAGLPDWQLMHPHRLRHYFITRAHDRFQDIATTRDLAGHTSERTTLRYIRRLTPEKEAEKLEQLA